MNKSCGATSTSSMKFMPSTSISRSPPDPNLSKIGRTLSLSHLNHSKPSSCSTHTSSKSSWTYWASRVGKLIGKKSLSSTHSDLTEETLIAHNRRNRSNIVDNDYSNSSPYYRGVITAPPLNLVPGTSPRPKSHVTSISTASSFSSFIDIMKELGSCFRPVKVTERDNIKPADYATRKPLGPSHAATVSSSSTSISARQPKGSLFRDMNEAKKIKEKALLVDEEKPLRERVPESIPKPKPTPTPTLTPVPAPTLALPSSKDQVIINDKNSNEKLNEMREFVWANKYRPKALEDFICNRDKAMGLRTLVRLSRFPFTIIFSFIYMLPIIY